MTAEKEGQAQSATIDDLDKPVDESLLMGEDEITDPDKSDDEDNDAEGGGFDQDALARIAAEGEDDPEPKEKEVDKDGKFVPQARFNQIYAEKKALEEELEALRGKAESDKPADKPVVKITVQSLRDKESSIEDELEQALYDSDTDKSKELRAQLRTLRGQIDDLVMTEAETRAEKRIDSKREVEAFQSLAVSLETKYPVLNGETGDPEAIALVVELRDAYIARGMSLTKALQTAVEKIAPRFTKAEEKQADKEEGKPDARNVTAITRGAKDSNRIPPSDGGLGNRALTPQDTSDISLDQWEKLPQSERDKILAA